MTRVAWVSRHTPSPRLLEEVERRWPGARLVDAGGTFRDALEILARVQRAGATHAIVVAPLSVIARMCEHRGGITLWWAEAREVGARAESEWTVARTDGRAQHYVHDRLREIREVRVVFAEEAM